MLTRRSLRILDFDIENRPLSYWVPDRPTAEITSIASCWADDPSSMEVWLLAPPCFHCGGACAHLPPDVMYGPDLLARFTERYNQADIVTGHYIRAHDLPIINGALMEVNLPLLGEKRTIDTKLDMAKKADVPATQEYLLEVLDVRDVYDKPFHKYHMTQNMWREANRLTPKGIEFTKERVASDVYAHMALRLKMQSLGLLRPPKVWRPGTGRSEESKGRR